LRRAASRLRIPARLRWVRVRGRARVRVRVRGRVKGRVGTRVYLEVDWGWG